MNSNYLVGFCMLIEPTKVLNDIFSYNLLVVNVTKERNPLLQFLITLTHDIEFIIVFETS